MYDFFQESNVQGGADPGYGNLAYCPVKDITTFAAEPTSGTVEGDLRIITASHAHTAGKEFIKLSLYRDGAEGEGESKGEPGFPAKEYKFKGFVVGDTPQVREKVEEIAKQSHIVIIKDPDCTNPRLMQLGCECTPCVATWKFTSGNKLTGGKKGYVVEFMSNCLFDFEGTIVYRA